MIGNMIQTLEILRIEKKLSDLNTARCNDSISRINDSLTPFVVQAMLHKIMYRKHRINLSRNNLLLTVYSQGFKEFNIKNMSYKTINPIRFRFLLPGLVDLGYFDKLSYNRYRCTEKFDNYILSFKEEYRKALKKFSSIERIGNKRRLNRLD